MCFKKTRNRDPVSLPTCATSSFLVFPSENYLIFLNAYISSNLLIIFWGCFYASKIDSRRVWVFMVDLDKGIIKQPQLTPLLRGSYANIFLIFNHKQSIEKYLLKTTLHSDWILGASQNGFGCHVL